MMAITHSIAHAYPGPPCPPERMLEYLNERLYEHYTTRHSTFVTAFYGIYDPATRRLSLPCFGRPFENPWELCLTGTPQGVYACTQRNLYRATVRENQVEWQTLGGPIPPQKGTKYNYEWMPIVYDSKRDRLIHLMGTDEMVEVHARGS